MTRNWRVDEEALIPNWKGFELFLAPLQPPSSTPSLSLTLFLFLSVYLSLFLFPLARLALELWNTECRTNEHWPAKKSDNVLSRRCDLTSDFSQRGHILFPRSFLGVRCSKLSELPVV